VPLTTPRQDLERRRVRAGDHVRLVDPRQALDGAAVEPDALGERGLELGRRDRHRLEEPEHVGEPETDEADVPLLDRAENELLLPVHAPILPDRTGRARDGHREQPGGS
jgi:hypothetical protein